MPVATRQNKKGRKAGAFLFCTKVSLYTLLIWIVNCSNSCQYDGNSYSVMNNSLGKAFDSRALRSLAEALEEEAVQHDAPVAYEDEIEQDAPAVYEEATEQDAPVEHEEVIEQVAQDVAQEVAQEVAQDVAQEVAQDVIQEIAQEIAQEVAQEDPEELEEVKIEYNDDGTLRIRSTDTYKQPAVANLYKERINNFYRKFDPTITRDFEYLKKNVNLFNERERALEGDPSAIAKYPKGYWDPHLALQKALKEIMDKHNEYREMLANNFYDVKLMDDFENLRTNPPYIQREYGRLDLRPYTPKPINAKEDKGYYKCGKGKKSKRKSWRRKLLCCF
ncbi:Plasmodium exported protein, unknown function [Plasmodium knowlesi strain H]|uniref:Uncharacterized protein n=3 Tax=Plasmodium knowlesi TaxID=5850 RepID=A0A5K1VSD8_PLAKH|nr:uncharacterized protein PKNH_1401700 [Plasmodium knowlesi strain H]OTN64246.1 Uncharacterized protein PKNOH_S140218800 [Plasmodium knowlesi]CAA9990616.1 Plasmodium exported protein, unknown function [Plasmodium knowlesi strain H]SBO26049.1 Plasmodium exported protein, unknown function [Plasmodium knowlesi strain H]SBO28742.1 Plasmodium exported protein, unknown function [Plasmodium knowlesi strain H]VVS80090.1 Plasmodium exported protein, unknown function [Plasmodium knowlesi strain H]|eukprot:XP_002261908.1 [Plasmodium knowlesi strain H]